MCTASAVLILNKKTTFIQGPFLARCLGNFTAVYFSSFNTAYCFEKVVKMAPRPHSEKSSLPTDSADGILSGLPVQILSETPSPTTLSGATTPSPTPQEQVPVEQYVDTVVVQESNRVPDISASTPCFPTHGDVLPYDHSLPDFIRQITNQPNLSNLLSLSLRVISTLISLHRMAAYLPNLRELDLEGSVLNSLRDIGCNFKNLHILKVGRCQLESLDGTFGLTSLRELYAQKNFINDVSPCSNLPHIRHIDVSCNRIRNISYAGFLSVCTKLKSIVFTGNPATEVSDYRRHVHRILPQVETLDGISFLNEENAEESRELELIENYCEGSDSSAEVPDFSSVSPSDSMSNFLESEEDLFLLDKKNKQAKNLASLDQPDNVDYEIQEVPTDMRTNLQLQDEFQNLSLQQNKVKKGLLDQAKHVENRNVNIKQKCASIQKLDKDIENRSKKSNLLLNANFAEEFNLPSEISKRTAQEGENVVSSSASKRNDDPRKIRFVESESVRPSTATGPTSSEDFRAEEAKYGAIKRPSSAVTTRISVGEQSINEFCEPSKLTTGLPVCGNLTAALRNRKKVQNPWFDHDSVFLEEFQKPAETLKRLEVQLNGSGDNLDPSYGVANEDDLIGEDVLVTSKKWREAFRRFRSNNRAKWEEEEFADTGFVDERKSNLGTEEK